MNETGSDCGRVEGIRVYKKLYRKRETREIFFELGNKTKRITALSRLAHHAHRYIRPKTIVLFGNNIDMEKIRKHMQAERCSPKGYLIGTSYDGQYVGVLKGIEVCFQESGASVLIVKNNVLIKEEAECGAPDKYLLRVQ